MKFKITEDIDFSNLDGEFYKDGSDLFYYDGNKLKLVPPKIASKILLHSSLTQRARDAKNDPKYDPYDTSDYRNRLKQASASIKQKNILKKYNDNEDDDLSKISAEKRHKKLNKVEQPDPVHIKNAPIFDELTSNIRHFLVTNYGKPESSKEWTGTNPMQLDPDAASQERQYKPQKGKIPTVLVYFDRSYSWDDAAKTKLGWDIVSNFSKWHEAKKLKVIPRYFAAIVDSQEHGLGGSTHESVENVINDIKAYAPDNVVIITDSDSSDYHMANRSASVAVPGAVWIINVDTIAEGLEDHIHSSKEDKTYTFYFKVH